MPRVTFILLDGTEETIEATAGTTVMFAALTNGVDGIEAECGGCLTCGTCHVYVEAGAVDPASAEETAMLAALNGERRPESRLGCQLRLVEGARLTLRIPQEQG